MVKYDGSLFFSIKDFLDNGIYDRFSETLKVCVLSGLDDVGELIVLERASTDPRFFVYPVYRLVSFSYEINENEKIDIYDVESLVDEEFDTFLEAENFLKKNFHEGSSYGYGVSFSYDTTCMIGEMISLTPVFYPSCVLPSSL